MKKIIFILVITSCSFQLLNSQSQIQRTIGGINDDGARSIIRTVDGGFAAAGYTGGVGESADMYVVKLNANGLQWSRTIGGALHDEAYCIIQTSDGGYVVAGETAAQGKDMYIIKLDANGTLQWSRNVERTSGDIAYSVIQTSDGGYVAAGQTGTYPNYDMYIVKLNSSGALQWSKTVGGANYELAYSIIQTSDGGFAVVGQTGVYSNYDMFIVKLNSSGSLEWSRTAGGAYDDIAYSIIQTTDGGLVVAGTTRSFGAGGSDMYILKLSQGGTLQWSRTAGGTIEEIAYSIIQTTDGGFAVAGNTNTFGAGFWDVYVVKIDGIGTLQWSRTVGGTYDENAHSIIQTTDGGFAVAGYTNSFGTGLGDMYIVMLDASGNTCGNISLPSSSSGTGGTTTSPTSTVNSPSTVITMPTPTTGTGGTLTTICVIGIKAISKGIPDSYQLSQNYPNPFNPSTKIKFSIPLSRGVDVPSLRVGLGVFTQLVVYDILGKEITTLVNQQLQPGTYEAEWDGSNYPSGVYFYKLITEQFTETRKMVLIK